MKLITLLLAAGTLVAQETRIDASLLTVAVNGLVRGTQVHLNTYGPRRGDSWYVADSWLQLPSSLAAMRVPLDIAEIRGGPDNAFRIYLDNINLQSMNVAVEDQFVRVRLTFEENGPEARTQCVNNVICGFTGNPTAQIHRFQVDVLLRPIIEAGRITYREALVRTTADASVDCGILDWLCNEVTRIKDVASATIVNEFRRAFEDDRVRRPIADALNRLVEALRLPGPPTAIFFAPGRRAGTTDLVIRTSGSGPPPAPTDTAIVTGLQLTLRTGGDDLRCGGQAFASVRTSAGWSSETALTDGRGLAGRSVRVAPLPAAGPRIRDILGLRIRHQSGACNEPFAGPDNWDLSELVLEYRTATGSGVLVRDIATNRFTQQRPTQTWTIRAARGQRQPMLPGESMYGNLRPDLSAADDAGDTNTHY